jgi:hypothetical protein
MQLMETKHYSVRMFSDAMDECHDGREDTEDGPRTGRPTDCRNDNNVEKICQLLLQNHHLSPRMLADEVNTGKDTVRKIRCMGRRNLAIAEKLRFQKSRVGIMLVIFFDLQGVIHKEFVPEGETINAVY